VVKENNGGGWSSDSMVLWLRRRSNKDIVEWWRVTNVEITFYRNEGGSWTVQREGGRHR
jgi:hypothetical protein